MEAVGPLVSIVIPTYNRAALLKHAILSAAGQTYRNIEILVVDDGSTDDTADVVEALAAADQRIRYIAQDNAGASMARNHGARLANGTMLSFLDSDDAYRPECIELKVRLFQQGDYVLIGGGCEYIDADGQPTHRPDPGRETTTYADLCIFTAFPGGTNNIFVDTATFRALNGFDSSLMDSEDRDLLRRFAEVGAIVSIKAPLVKVRFHDEERINRNIDTVLRNRIAITRSIKSTTLRRRSHAWNFIVVGDMHWDQERKPAAAWYWLCSFAHWPAPVHADLPRLSKILRTVLGR